MLIDKYLGKFDFREQHHVVVAGSPPEIYTAAAEVDFADLTVIRWLLRLRGMSTSNFSLRSIEGSIFKKLEEDAGSELVLGLIGRFWTIYGDLQPISSAADFLEFEKPGYAKAVWNFSVADEGGRSRVATETRIRCLDEASRIRFAWYWTLVQPFSGLMRMEMLRAIKRRVELKV